MKEIFLLPIKFYRKFISPLHKPCCKYYPTCSTYALRSVEKFGIIKGGWLAIKRVFRCNPWSLGGIDHVPDEYHYFEKWRTVWEFWRNQKRK
ncbi:MAG: membrane protein insertion efficiency factor YidD [Oscillospiraceae bacterium]